MIDELTPPAFEASCRWAAHPRTLAHQPLKRRTASSASPVACAQRHRRAGIDRGDDTLSVAAALQRGRLPTVGCPQDDRQRPGRDEFCIGFDTASGS